MKQFTLVLFFVCVASAFSQQTRVGILPFKNDQSLTSVEAHMLTNYTAAQIEKLGTFEVYDHTKMRQLFRAQNITIPLDDQGNLTSLFQVGVYYAVEGKVAKRGDRYTLSLKVTNLSKEDSYLDKYEIYSDVSKSQQRDYQDFLRRKSGLRDIQDKTQWPLRSPALHRMGGSIWFTSGIYSYPSDDAIPDVQNYYFPVGVRFEGSFGANAFLILGGTYFHHTLAGKNIENELLNYTTADFLTAKGGLGVRFWRIRTFFTYELTAFKLPVLGVSEDKLKTIPSGFTTAGLQVYLLESLFVGTEIFFFQPVYFDYDEQYGVISDVEDNGTTYFPTFSFGFQF